MVEVTWVLLAMLIAGGAVLVRKAIRDAQSPLASDERVGWALLVALTTAALSLRIFILPHHHAMYVDEPWYEEAARNFLRKGALVLCEESSTGETCRPYPKSAGWPAILSLAFAIGGAREHVAFLTSATLGALATPIVAAVTLLAGGRWHHALLAAALMALHPLHLQWSVTAETNAASITLLLAGLAGVLAYENAPSVWGMLLATGGLGSAAAVRPELWLAFLPALPLLLRRAVRTRSVPHAVIALVGAILGGLPVVYSGDAFFQHDTGVLLQGSNIGANLELWATNLREGGPLSAAIVMLGAVGLVVSLVRGRFAVAVLLGGATLLIGVFVLFYYPSVAFYSRTMLGAVACAVPLAVLSLPGIGPGRWRRAGQIIAVVLMAGLVRISWTDREFTQSVAFTQRFETMIPDFARQQPWPADSLVIAEWPTVLTATTDLKVAATSKAIGSDINALIRQAKARPVFLLCDMFCESGFVGENEPSGCQRALDGLALEEAWMIPAGERNYGFLRVIGPAVAGQQRPKCPRH